MADRRQGASDYTYYFFSAFFFSDLGLSSDLDFSSLFDVPSPFDSLFSESFPMSFEESPFVPGDDPPPDFLA